MRPLSRPTALFSATLLTTFAACAQERPAAAASAWSLGALGSSETSPYAGVESRQRVLPLLGFENAYVRVAGPMIDLKWPAAGAVSYALVARYADLGYQASDSAVLTGMTERKSSVWLGAKADWRQPWGQLSAMWLADAAGHSRGQQWRLAAEKTVRWGGLGLAPRVGVVWQDRKFVDYYFGVRDNETRTGRPSYAGKAAFSPELGLRAFYGLSAQQSVFLDVSATRLGSSLENSPIVDRKWLSGVRLGYAFRF